MTIYNILRRLLAICLGLAFTAADGLNTLRQAIESNMTNDLVITIGVIIVGMSLSLPIAVWSFTKQNKVYGSLAILVFVGCWVVSYGFSVNRMGTNKMNEAHDINKANMRGALAAEKLEIARAKLIDANRNLAREEVSGRGPRWKEANYLKQQAEREMRDAESQMEPMKNLPTFQATMYLVYVVPLVAQAGGVVCFLIGFGALKAKKNRVDLKSKIETSNYLSVNRQDELSVFNYLKHNSKNGRWKTSYRKISDATGVNTALVKERLTDLVYSGAIRIDGCSKGKGTWGVIIERELA